MTEPNRIDDESVSKLTAEDLVGVDPIETAAPIYNIVNLYKSHTISRREFVGLMLFKKQYLFDINIQLWRDGTNMSFTPKPDRVLSIIGKLESDGRRMTGNILRQQTGWLKDDCQRLLDVMTQDGSIKLVQETIQGKVVSYYVLPTQSL